MTQQKMTNLPNDLSLIIDKIRNNTTANKKLARIALQSLDLTSLNDNDNKETIKEFCNKYHTDFGHPAAICVYKEFIKTVKNELGNNTTVATVISFPNGSDDIDTIINDTTHAIDEGADEIDIVFNYNAFLNNGKAGKIKSHEALKACKNICGDNIKMKVILETGAFDSYDELLEASISSIKSGADFLKTSTGKLTNKSGATLEAAITFMQAIKETNSNAGIKLSGGIKTVHDTAIFIELANNIMGKNWIDINHFRFGASGIIDSLISYLNDEQTELSALKSKESQSDY